MKREIKESLLEIGLTNFQVDLYVAILRHPLASVLEISKVMGKNRQQIYNDAERLVTLGLLEKTNKQKRKYLASSPNKILELAREREAKAVDVLEKISDLAPDLEKIIGNYKTQVVTRVYEGTHQIKEAYERELSLARDTEVQSLVGDIGEVYEMFPEEYWGKWNKKFVKNKSRSRMIVHSQKEARISAESDKKYQRETKYIEGLKLKINIDIFERHVLLVSFRDKFAVWIESEIVANSYKIMFETLWGIAKS